MKNGCNSKSLNNKNILFDVYLNQKLKECKQAILIIGFKKYISHNKEFFSFLSIVCEVKMD